MPYNVLTFFKRLFFDQRQEVDNDRQSQNARLVLILKASKQRIWCYDRYQLHYLYNT